MAAQDGGFLLRRRALATDGADLIHASPIRARVVSARAAYEVVVPPQYVSVGHATLEHRPRPEVRGWNVVVQEPICKGGFVTAQSHQLPPGRFSELRPGDHTPCGSATGAPPIVQRFVSTPTPCRTRAGDAQPVHVQVAASPLLQMRQCLPPTPLITPRNCPSVEVGSHGSSAPVAVVVPHEIPCHTVTRLFTPRPGHNSRSSHGSATPVPPPPEKQSHTVTRFVTPGPRPDPARSHGSAIPVAIPASPACAQRMAPQDKPCHTVTRLITPRCPIGVSSERCSTPACAPPVCVATLATPLITPRNCQSGGSRPSSPARVAAPVSDPVPSGVTLAPTPSGLDLPFEKLYDEDWWFLHLEDRRAGGAPADNALGSPSPDSRAPIHSPTKPVVNAADRRTFAV